MSLCYLVVAKTGHGKTTLALKIAKKLVKERRGRCWLFDPHGNVDADFCDKVKPDEMTGADGVRAFFSKGKVRSGDIVIFDDARIFFPPSNRKSIDLAESMLIRKRHEDICYIFVYHSITQISGNIHPFFDVVYLGVTNDEKSVLKNFADCIGENGTRFAANRPTERFSFLLIDKS